MEIEKSPDAFRTISEVSEDLDLPQHVLRFWETRFAQIKPLKRGGGRRYYRPQDVELIQGIRHLLYDQGYTIKGVQKILREQGIRFAIALGSGDVDAAEAIAAQKRAAEDEAPGDIEADTAIVGESKIKPSKRFFGFGNHESPEDSDNPGSQLSRENRALLQEALFDLLECKRLLDQTR